ncbi:MAG: S8 family serine peptidase, partial [Planctomycetota bacterium]
LDTPGLERLEYRGVDDTGSPLFTAPDTPQDGALGALFEAAGIRAERREATEQSVRQLLVRVNEDELGNSARPAVGERPVVNEIEGFICVSRHAFETHVSYVVDVPDEGLVPDAVHRLRGTPGVTYIEPNYFSVPSTSRAPTPPSLIHPFPNDATMLDTWWLLAIGAPQAWSRVQGDRDVIVAVLDSGIDKTHPDLADRIVGGMNYFSDEDPEPADDWGHGTHCAGIIGATGNNDFGTTGVCWRVSLLPQRIMRSNGARAEFVGEMARARAIRDAVDQGARVISISWGLWSKSAEVSDALSYAAKHGVVVVAAVSNRGRDCDRPGNMPYPAAYPHSNIIRVMACDMIGNRAMYSETSESDYGMNSVHLAAPGIAVYAAVPKNGPGCDTAFDNVPKDCPVPVQPCRHGYLDGTSTAAPVVAGAVALLLSTERYGNLTPVEVRRLLLLHSRTTTGLQGLCSHSSLLDISFLATVTDIHTTGVLKIDTDRWQITTVSGSTDLDVRDLDAAARQAAVALEGMSVVVLGRQSGQGPLRVRAIRDMP